MLALYEQGQHVHTSRAINKGEIIDVLEIDQPHTSLGEINDCDFKKKRYIWEIRTVNPPHTECLSIIFVYCVAWPGH